MIYVILFIFFIGLLSIPHDAHAYLAPLIGGAGAILAGLLIIITGIASVFFMLHNFIKKIKNKIKKNNKDQSNTPENQ